MRFLIVKTSAFGDVVQAFASINYIKSLFPEAQIDWVVERKIAALVHAHPQVDRVIEINAKEWKKGFWKIKNLKEVKAFIQELRKYSYDAVFDLQGNTKSAFITLFAKSKSKVGFGWKTAPERLNCCVTKYRANPPRGQNVRRDYLFILQNYFKDTLQPQNLVPYEEVSLRLTPDEKELFSSICKQIPEKNVWMVCPSSQWINKKLKSQTLRAFLHLAYEKYRPFFVFTAASADELREAKTLSAYFPNSYICDHMPLPMLQNMMRRMDLVISMDSLPLHLAATTQVPTCSFFGPSLSFKYRPLGERHFSFQGNCPYDYRFEKRCPILRTCATGACMRDIKEQEAFTAFSSWWDMVRR